MNLVGILEQYEVHEYEMIIKYTTVGQRFGLIGKIARKQDLMKQRLKNENNNV